MNDLAKFIIQFIVIPLVIALMNVIIFLCKHEMKAIKEKIEEEKKERKDEIGKLNMEMREKITHSSENIGKIFSILQEINEKLGDVKSTISAHEERIANLKDNIKRK
jgi:methyl-accepting chemotaxis protein